jgi:5'-3' exonuclease
MNLIVDISYAVFYRFYAIKSYLKISKQNGTISLNIDDERFRELYMKTFCDMMQKLATKFKASTILFCVDCPREKIWRRVHMPTYKNRRQLDDFDGRVFKYTFEEVIPELKERLKAKKSTRMTTVHLVSHPHCEADDIAYVISRQILGKDKKVIITGDHDYLQLLDENTEIYNLKYASLKDKSRGDNDTDILSKCICGDVSDNIPKLMSKKELENLFAMRSNEDIKELFSADERFQMNMRMIDLRYIPEEYVNEIKSTFDLDEECCTNG